MNAPVDDATRSFRVLSYDGGGPYRRQSFASELAAQRAAARASREGDDGFAVVSLGPRVLATWHRGQKKVARA